MITHSALPLLVIASLTSSMLLGVPSGGEAASSGAVTLGTYASAGVLTSEVARSDQPSAGQASGEQSTTETSTPTVSEQPSSDQTDTAQPVGELMVTKSAVHVRSGPSTEYGVTRTLLKGAKVWVVGTKKGWNADKKASVPWSKLSTGGWISSDLLTSAGAPLKITGVDLERTRFRVNVRSGPSTEYGIIKQYDAETEVTVVATKRGWSATDKATVNWSKLSEGGWIVSYALSMVESDQEPAE